MPRHPNPPPGPGAASHERPGSRQRGDSKAFRGELLCGLQYTLDDYEPAPPELCTAVTVQSKYDLLRLAGQKKRAEQDAQALRTRRRRPSFLPKELERIETALKQKDAKRQQAAFLAPSWPPADKARSVTRLCGLVSVIPCTYRLDL
jgi:hypothetical protein